MKIYRPKNPIPLTPLTEGEPYCPYCMRHIDSCGCLEVIEVEDLAEDERPARVTAIDSVSTHKTHA